MSKWTRKSRGGTLFNDPIILPLIANANLPAGTGAQKGMMAYDSTNDKIVFYNGSAWVTTSG